MNSSTVAQEKIHIIPYNTLTFWRALINIGRDTARETTSPDTPVKDQVIISVKSYGKNETGERMHSNYKTYIDMFSNGSVKNNMASSI